MTHNMMFNKIADTIRVTMELHVKPYATASAQNP